MEGERRWEDVYPNHKLFFYSTFGLDAWKNVFEKGGCQVSQRGNLGIDFGKLRVLVNTKRWYAFW